jgi:DNA-binding NarL/FixJ family response regulator
MSVAATESSMAPVRVSIVEDHEELRTYLCDLLGAAGMHVVSAVGTMADGLRTISHHLPDVAVVDNHLPDGRGIELCRLVVSRSPQVRVLLHTGVIGPCEVRDALSAGAEAVIPKSARGHDLIAAIKRRSPA